ncbi:MAG: gliding motility-associated peptidyl-prolyl isomerase GldI [Flavobacteriaceae bacterium]|nr:gliding motility-associated peptidyl-prolyl isomerase GldI [Flavobacteriaceae bacterium]
MRFKTLLFLFLIIPFLSCKQPEARKPITKRSGSFLKTSVLRNKALYAEEEKTILNIIKQDSLHKYFTSEKGFWYTYIKTNSATVALPKPGDQIEFEYEIKTLKGRLIYSKEELGIQKYLIDQSNQELISGIREGLKLMKSGETIRFLLPSHKAFGYYGDQNKIGTNIPIITIVTLNTITKIKQ